MGDEEEKSTEKENSKLKFYNLCIKKIAGSARSDDGT